MYYVLLFFVFKQKTAYEVRISDWSSDVCSSDLALYQRGADADRYGIAAVRRRDDAGARTLGRRARRDRGADRARERADRGCARGDHRRAFRAVGVSGDGLRPQRAEERRVGKECVSKSRSRWSP